MKPVTVPQEALRVRTDCQLVQIAQGEALTSGDGAYFLYYQPSTAELTALQNGGLLELAWLRSSGVALNVRTPQGAPV